MTERRCGDCQLCCKLLPVRSLAKGAGQRCGHQRALKGCAVYAKLMRVAPECRLWNCRWLVNDDAAELRRPDRTHYVIDIIPDFVTVVGEDGGETATEIVQIWIDPSYPDAHRDPALRDWLERREKPALIRFSDTDAFVLAPPSVTGGGWLEHSSNNRGKAHTFEEVVRALSGGQEGTA